MARVTVEDCLKNVDNRFELVLVAAKRARELMLTGVNPTVDWDNDKATVVALREIAKGTITAKILDEAPVTRPDPSLMFDIPEKEAAETSTETKSAEDELFMVANPAVEEVAVETVTPEAEKASLLSVDAD